MGFVQILCIVSALIHNMMAAPSPKPGDAEVSGSISGKIPPLLTFDNGNIGVNFLGFKASAGLGGLLAGDATQGGLHAEAETPFGQKAGAGLGGAVGPNGGSIGGLYAGATAGGGVGAAAGLDGATGVDGSAGRSYAGATAGGVSKTVVKERFGAPAASFSVQKNVEIAPVAHSSHIQVIKEVKPVKASTTYVERSVVPNYVEKTIQVPSYVEKTIRVPTVIEKKIRVPAPPTVIEKEVEVPVKPLVQKEYIIQNEEIEVPPPVVVTKTRTKVLRRPWLHFRKRINIDTGAGTENGYYGGVAAGRYGYGDGYYNGYKGGNQGTYTTTVRKQFNPQLINDIFNIPIATLGAVSNLVGGIASGASGSVAVSKSYSH